MNHFFTELFYGTFIAELIFPRKISSLALIPAPYMLAEKNNTDAIIAVLKDFDNVATQDSISFRALHNLSWLCDLSENKQFSEKQTAFLAQFLEQILPQYHLYDKKLWEINLLSERLVFSICAISPLTSILRCETVKNNLQVTILRHAIFLRKSLNRSKKHPYYGMFLIRSAFASLALSEERHYLQQTLGKLYQYLENSFTNDGNHLSRNASFQLRFLTELILLRDFLVKAGVSVSSKLQSIIAKSCDYLEFLRHPDGKFSIFNGAYENHKSIIDKILAVSPGKINKSPNCLKKAQYYRLISHNTFIIADFSTPLDNMIPAKKLGSFPFELSVGNKRVFVNCGSGEELNQKWGAALQQSEAFNTITVENAQLSLTTKKPNIPGKNGKKIISAITSQGTILEGAQLLHCSFEKEKPFDISHYRRLLLHKGGSVIQGEDWIFTDTAKKDQSLSVACRFHLAPKISAHISKSGSVIIDIGEYGQRIFSTGSGKISLEDSVYVGAGYPQKTKQIVIRATITSPLLKIRWAMQTVSPKNNQKESSVEKQTTDAETT